jgi:hypothetical protein
LRETLAHLQGEKSFSEVYAPGKTIGIISLLAKREIKRESPL